MKALALFDIDGTLADISHRRHLVEGNSSNWSEFFDLMGEDTPNKPIVDLYKTIKRSNEYKCILISGRPERYRSITEQWLVWNDIPFERLIMRPDGDTRPDHIIKEEVLDSLQECGEKIAFVIDDRQSVVNMWRRNGITCLQCADYKD